LIISSKPPIPTDSVGILSFKLPSDTLENFLWGVDNTSAKIYSRNFDDILIRVTYRYHEQIKQYYVTNRKVASAYLLTIENELINNNDSGALKKFYLFISKTGLVKGVRGKIVWKEFQ
jgi:hypothetical protein